MNLILKIKVLIVISYCEARIFSVSGARQARLSVFEPLPYYYYNNIDGNPGSYSFGYDVSDPLTGDGQYRTEERHPNGTVTGSYGYIDPSGRPHRYRYVADHRGYRVMSDQRQPFQPKPSPIPSPRPRPIDPALEPSITWTRPRKPSKKKPIDQNRKKWNNNRIHPPSYYASVY